MAKPRIITRTITMLRDATQIHVTHPGRFKVLRGAVPETMDGTYIIIPRDEAGEYVTALDREDHRELRVKPTLRKRHAVKKSAKRKAAR